MIDAMRSGWMVIAMACACGDDGGSGVPVDAPKAVDARPDSPPPSKYGRLDILEDKSTSMTYVLGIFTPSLDAPAVARDDGPCHIEGRIPFMVMRVSAGTLTIAASAAPTLTIPYDLDTSYLSMASGLTYAANEALTVSTAGATVPAFSTPILFPPLVTVTSGTPTVLKKSGFTATWSATTGPVEIGVRQYPSGLPQLWISCVFDGAAGTGTIPASALTDLVTGVSAGIRIATNTGVTLMPGGYPTQITATYSALNKNGIPVQP
jgi:hypothetical protein